MSSDLTAIAAGYDREGIQIRGANSLRISCDKRSMADRPVVYFSVTSRH